MTFLTPGLAILVAAIGVPSLILLHVLRLRRLPQRVPSTLLWRRSVQDLEANVPFQRLRVSWLFVLQMLALICAALAAGQPILRHGAAPSTLVIVLDTRARMNAVVDQPVPTTAESKASGSNPAESTSANAAHRITRFDLARDRARDLIRDRSSGDTLVHLVVSRATPGLVASGSSRAVLDALDRVPPTDEPGDADLAMGLAAELAPDGEIAWIGDPAPGAVRRDNIGLTVLSAQHSTQEPGMVDVLVSAVSSTEGAVEAPLVITLDGAAMAARLLRLPAPGIERDAEPARATLLLRVPARANGLLEARLAVQDAFALDDVAAMRLSPAAPIRVAFMAPADHASPLLALLQLMDSVRVEVVPCAASTEALRAFDLVVADGCVPSLGEIANAPPALVFAWESAAAGHAARDVARDAGRDAATTAHLRRATIPGAARSHPLLQGVPPFSVDVRVPDDAVQPPRIGAASLPPNSIVLLAERDDVLASIDPRAPSVRFEFPLAATDWPADPSWVMVMQNAILWLVGDDGESAGSAIRSGVPARVLLEQKDGSRAWVRVPAQTQVGTIEVRSPDGSAVSHPVSLLDEAQSDLRLRSAPADPRGMERRAPRAPIRADDPSARTDADDSLARDEASESRAPRSLWPWLACAALTLMLAEWTLYAVSLNRRGS